jgi:hypothetical protein
MGFSVFVEMINLRIRRGAPVQLKHRYEEPVPPGGRPDTRTRGASRPARDHGGTP